MYSLLCADLKFFFGNLRIGQNVLDLFPVQIIFHATDSLNKRDNYTGQKFYVQACIEAKNK